MTLLNVITVEFASAHLTQRICNGSTSHEIQYDEQNYQVQSIKSVYEEIGKPIPDHFHYATGSSYNVLSVYAFVSSDITEDYACITLPITSSNTNPVPGNTATATDTITAESPVECTESLDDTDVASFTLEIKEGYNFMSLPFTVIGVDNRENELEYISDLFNAIQPDVNYIYSVGLDEFKYTSNGGDNPELDPSFGFVIVMTRERTVELQAERPATTPVEADFTIREGYGVYGVPIDSEDLETVGDFFDLFSSVWAIFFQLESQDYVLIQRSNTKHLDEPIRGEASYMIHSSAEETVTLEGELWETLPVSPAPQLRPTFASVISSWAQLKRKAMR